MIAFIRTSNRAIVSGNQAQHYRKLAELMEVIGRCRSLGRTTGIQRPRCPLSGRTIPDSRTPYI
jgi:hypothetical protein